MKGSETAMTLRKFVTTKPLTVTDDPYNETPYEIPAGTRMLLAHEAKDGTMSLWLAEALSTQVSRVPQNHLEEIDEWPT